MKITKLELIKVKTRWMFLKMYTDTDIVGLGEPILEGHCNAVDAVVKEFEDYFPYEETEDYVRRVINTQKKYQKLYNIP